MGATTLALPAFEVAVRRRCTSLAGLQLVGVHPQTHRATGATPLRAGLLEHHVEALLLGLEPDPHGSRYDEQPGALVHLTAREHLGGRTQVLDASVGARA